VTAESDSRKRGAIEKAKSCEIAWMHQALEANTLKEYHFLSLLRLIEVWPDSQILALARSLYPGQSIWGKGDALARIAGVHRRRTQLLLELEADELFTAEG
jgi:hypothetical protein